MRATLLILSLFGLLFVTSCGGTVGNAVFNAAGAKVGEIRFENETTSTIVDEHGEELARVRGDIVRDVSSKKLGTLRAQGNIVVIVDGDGNEVGTLEKDTECYGKTQTLLGNIGTKLDPEAAAAACLVLLIQG